MRHIICFHNPEEENGYLSNWYPSPFEKDGISFAHMEQYMMYQKALQFQDTEIAQQILQTDNPGKVKALGRSVRNYDCCFNCIMFWIECLDHNCSLFFSSTASSCHLTK